MMKCYAKDPSKCRYHGGTYSSAEEAVESLADSIFSDLDRIMVSRNPAFAKQLVIVELNRKLKEELAERYEFTAPTVVEDFAPLGVDDRQVARFNEDFRRLNASISSEEQAAIYKYAGVTYWSLNQMLYDPAGFRKRYESNDNYLKQKRKLSKQVRVLDSAISKAPEPGEPRQLFRVLYQEFSSDKLFSLKSSEDYAASLDFKEGEIVEQKGFLSTSIDPGYINQKVSKDGEHVDVVMVITSRKGIPVTKTVSDAKHSQNIQDMEREILLPRGGRYRVTRVARTRFQPRTEWDDAVEPLTVYLEEV